MGAAAAGPVALPELDLMNERTASARASSLARNGALPLGGASVLWLGGFEAGLLTGLRALLECPDCVPPVELRSLGGSAARLASPWVCPHTNLEAAAGNQQGF